MALLSAWHSIGHVHRVLGEERRTYAQLTPAEQRQEPTSLLGINGGIFDFFASYLAPGDRVYFQVEPSGFSSDIDLPTAISDLGNFYFLPAMQTTSLADATVVVSYFEDPALLHVKFVTQVRAGLQPIWVSRIKSP